jgi:hypothetical protein
MSRERYQCDWPEACEKTALLLFLIEDRREIGRRYFYSFLEVRRCVSVLVH